MNYNKNQVEKECNIHDSKFSDELYLQIIKTYLDTESVKETAKALETSVVKVRKVLITEKLWSSKTSLEVQHYLNIGKTTAEIANILSTTEKAVQQYLPYTKGIYKGDNPSVGALNTADYRERIRIAQEKTLRQNMNMAMLNKWYEMYEKPKTAIERESVESMDFDPDECFFPGELIIPKGTDTSRFKSPFSLEPVRLHLELVLPHIEHIIGLNDKAALVDYQNEEYQEIVGTLKKYADVKYGDTISRDIVVPGEMPLWALNYVIQKCFGWENSHLHCFELSDEQFRRVCDGESRKFVELMGVAFRSIWMDEQEEFWNDDYEDGSFKTWLRSKYTGPYESMCHGEGIWQCKQDVKEMKKRYRYVSVEHTVGANGYIHYSYPEAITKQQYEEMKPKCPIQRIVADGFRKDEKRVTEVFTFDEIPFDAMRWMAESGMNRVLERLSVYEVFIIHDKSINDSFFGNDTVPSCFADVMNEDVKADVEEYKDIDYPDAQPYVEGLTDELIYNYDYGDGWKVRITASFGAADLIESGRVTQEELDDATIRMHETWRPVCIAKDGMNVLDDVGGVHGYVQFLRGINQKRKMNDEYDGWSEEYGLYGDKEESLEWAKSLGWSKRKISNRNML